MKKGADLVPQANTLVSKLHIIRVNQVHMYRSKETYKLHITHAPYATHLQHDVLSCERVLRVHPNVFCEIEVDGDDTAVGEL